LFRRIPKRNPQHSRSSARTKEEKEEYLLGAKGDNIIIMFANFKEPAESETMTTRDHQKLN